MTVDEFIKILLKEVKKEDRKNANIEFYIGEKQYDIKSMSGFSLSPDINIYIKKITSPVLKQMTFKKEHSQMVNDKLKEIKKTLKKQKRK